MDTITSVLLERLGPGAVVTGSDLAARDLVGVSGRRSEPGLLALPSSTADVATVLSACSDAGVPVIPLGGGTGLVDGTQADVGQVVISLERLRGVESVDPVSRTMIVGAGTVLAEVHDAAASHGLSFPVDLGARGSAQVGGLIATNAGGNGVVRFGMTRENVLGLEVVLADGTILESMNAMVKDNTGYDLKHLFFGSEGTLGVVTKAVLRLRPAPVSRHTALLAVPSFEAMTRLLNDLEGRLGGSLSAFEALWLSFYEVILASGRHQAPLPANSPLYALVEAQGGDPDRDEERFHAAIEAASEDGIVTDAVLAMSAADRERLWAIRDDIPALVEAVGTKLNYDVSLPLPAMEGYLATIGETLGSLIVFGHLGDGNLHVIPADGVYEDEANQVVYDALVEYGGSVSAEHGIGEVKRPYLDRSRTPEELAAMRAIKTALDPKGIMNPGKVL